MIWNFFKQNILYSGTRPEYSNHKNLAIRVFNFIAIIVFALLLAFHFADEQVGAFTLSKLNLVANFLVIVSFLLVRFGYSWMGRFLFGLAVNGIVFLGNDQLGMNHGGQFFYFCCGLIPFVVFERQHFNTVRFLCVLPLISWGVSAQWGSQIFLHDNINQASTLNDYNMGFFFAYLVSLVAFAYFYVIYESSQSELALARARLAHQSQMSVLGEMAGGMAHEINNPLTIIVGKIQIMQLNLEKGPMETKKLLEYIESIEKSSNRITNVIKSLAAFSKNIEDDPLEYKDLRHVILSTLELCQQRFPNTEVVVYKNRLEPVLMECRPGHLSQALYSVMQNAFEAATVQNEKWIRIEMRRIDTRECEISVTDSGPGISPILRHKIFEPFFTTKDVGHGSGLGLAAAKGLIEAQGGSLELDAISSNTRFVIRLTKP